MSGVEREQGQVPTPWPCGGVERGGGRSAWHAHKQGPPTGSGVGAMEAGSGRARGTEQSGERRGPVGWAPSGRERGAWAAPGTYGLAEEKEGAGPGLIEQCQFRFKTNF
jgi:hypothetical protein